ncbi:unnamed protein product [Prorocentrum cordatum]|uniref:Helicase ATP-binding domain-containing protein n=1 Tax=Prorocentrum cordatum TaxID=2364126 RepID=A0ABN9TMY9_9DINO|nr:unnamed protein product [Polarella glacialis]
MEDRGVDLYPAQEEAVVEIFGGCHVVLDTPTGSGKSLVAVAAFFKALGEGRRAYYTSPTKALASEKFFDLCRFFGPGEVGMATGDVSVNTRASLICCTQEVLAMIALRDGEAARVDCVVMDEFHYYGDPSRGAAWEIPLWRLPRASFLLMSGTLGENSGLYAAIEDCTGRPLRVVSSQQRPVPLDYSYSDLSVTARLRELKREGKCPAYVVHFSHREALSTAQQLANDPALELPGAQLAALRAAVDAVDFSSPFGACLRQLLLRGVGVHHAGVLPRYRRLVEQLAQASLLVFVCGTDTLGVGVNVPIRSVLFTRLCKFTGEETDILDARSFHQIAGRAGRRGFDDRGEVAAVAPEWEVYNRELRERIARGERVLPQWRRPPRQNYRHWTRSTFDRLQRSSPGALRSSFRLSMAQVLSVLQGAEERGTDGPAELRQLVDRAQCGHGERRYWHRQVATFSELFGQGSSFATTPSRIAAAGSGAAERSPGSNEGEAQPVTAPLLLQQAPAPTDDASVFFARALPRLEAELGKHAALAALAAVEAMCQVPESLGRMLRTRGPSGPTPPRGEAPRREDGQTPDAEAFACPPEVAAVLCREFVAFRTTHPWVPEGALQPKGLAREMVSRGLDFTGLVQRLGDHARSDTAVTSEGAILRYLSDVYRTMRCSVPEAVKTPGIRRVQSLLRAAVASVDSSLLDEWESLKAIEDGDAAAEAGSSDGQAREDVAGGGTMVPARASGSVRPRRSEPELRDLVRSVRRRVEQQRRRRDAEAQARARSLSGRLRRLGSAALGAAERVWHSVIGAVW